MERVVILGRGGADKSTFARRLGSVTGLPVIELDRWFWQPDLLARPREEWAAIQRELGQREAWIADGDLGPYDVVDPRLEAADTVIILNFPLARCAWRSIRRSSERLDYWRWVIGYRRRSLPVLMAAIARSAPGARVEVLRTPRAAEMFLGEVRFAQRPGASGP
jgi:adenylate kinase family enzyme